MSRYVHVIDISGLRGIGCQLFFDELAVLDVCLTLNTMF